MSASYDTKPVYCEEPGRPATEERGERARSRRRRGR